MAETGFRDAKRRAVEVERREVEEDLRKTKLQKILFLFGGLGLFALAIALFVTFMFRREVPALILACVALIFGALLLNQSMRTREIEDMISARLSALPVLEGEPPGGDAGSSQESDDESSPEEGGEARGPSPGDDGVEGRDGGEGDVGDTAGGGEGA